MASEFDECLEAISYILKRRGVVGQNSVRAYTSGKFRFERTNTNDIELTVNGRVVLFAPPPGSSKQVNWEPGGWVREILEFRERIEHSDLVDEGERVSRAKEYCEGYVYGINEGRKYPASEADSGGPSYRAGFARGVSAANRARHGDSSANESLDEIISHAIRRLDDERITQGGAFTEEQSKEWNSFQACIKANGEKSWQDLLLELFDRLNGFEAGALLTQEERAAIELLSSGVVARLAKTSLVLPIPG